MGRSALTHSDGKLWACKGEKGDAMGKEARIGLLLGASACLLAVMVDWVIEELHEHEKTPPGK